ncbi:MAG: hypothetical protein C5B57_06060 [Blastocatellia bacterium]|nr:MAG: hypothetical protein C5B57_06060 [Blastocatellia bacterium]
MLSETRVRSQILVIVLVGLAAVSIAAQTPHAARPKGETKTWAPPRTPWGDPDLEGIWPSTEMVGVPFERPAELAGRTELSDEEFAKRAEQVKQQSLADSEEFVSGTTPRRGDGTGPPSHWLEWGKPSRQASLVVEPADGKLPPMTPEGQRRTSSVRNTYVMFSGFADYTDFGPYDRCISRGVLGSTLPVIYNNGNQILQFPEYVVIRYEMIHETRIIPLDGRPHVSPAIRSYMGDPRGHWEGNTLVVRTTNFNGKTGAQANGNLLMTSDQLELVERFTRSGPDSIQYEVTVNDPKTWTRPWKVAFPLKRDPNYKIFEYACHEGNHAMSNILSASRAEDGR